MAISSDNYELLKQFLDEIYEMIHGSEPFVMALAEDPERREIEQKVIDSSFVLYQTIKRSGSTLGLANLVYLAEAYEYMLDRMRSGIQFLLPVHIKVLADGTRFLQEQLPEVWEQKSDHGCAPGVKKLSDAVMLLCHDNETGGPDGGYENGASWGAEIDDDVIGEVHSFLDGIEQEFVLWDYVAVDIERVSELSAMINHLVSSFSLLGLTELAKIGQVMEATLNRFIGGEFFQGVYPEQVFIRGVDIMREGVGRFVSSGDTGAVDTEKYLAALQGLIRQPLGELLVEAGLVAPDTVDEALLLQKELSLDRPLRLGEVLVEMGEVGEGDIRNLLGAQHQKGEKSQQAQQEVILDKPVNPQASAREKLPAELSLKCQTIARIYGLIRQLDHENTASGTPSSTIAELKSMCGPLERALDGVVAKRLNRIVREVAAQNQKKVFFSLSGKGVYCAVQAFEPLFPVLVHLLKNSIEHGLEAPDERTRLGKKVKGRVSLSLQTKNDELLIRIEDDGQGLDRKRIIQLAVAGGMLPQQDAEKLSNREVARLLVQQGLSTKDGGRNAFRGHSGLQAVRELLLSCTGKMDILFSEGKGTRVSLRLPAVDFRRILETT